MTKNSVDKEEMFLILLYMKRYFKFKDGSIGLFPINHKFLSFKPTHIYTSDVLGFGEWKKL